MYTTHNKHRRRTSVPSVGFEPAVPVKRPRTCALDCTLTWIGRNRGLVACMVNVGTVWRRVDSFTSCPLYPRVKECGTHRVGVWVILEPVWTLKMRINLMPPNLASSTVTVAAMLFFCIACNRTECQGRWCGCLTWTTFRFITFAIRARKDDEEHVGQM